MNSDRTKLLSAAKRLRQKKRQERHLRTGIHRCDTLESGQVVSVERVLYALRQTQGDVEHFERKYVGYRKRLLGR